MRVLFLEAQELTLSDVFLLLTCGGVPQSEHLSFLIFVELPH